VILDDKGHILTTHHVVDGAEKVIVTFADGRVLSGAVVGGDEETDIAVVRVDGKEFRAADYANSDELKVGQPSWRSEIRWVSREVRRSLRAS